MSGTWVRMGTVKSVNPARRELRVTPTRMFEDGAEGVTAVRVVGRDSDPVLCVVETLSANPAGLILTLGAGVSRDAVAGMKNASIEVETPQRTQPATTDTMTAEEWIGLEIFGADDFVGKIVGCIESPAHDILEIETPEGQRLLLPAIEQTVESIDLDTKRVTVGDIASYVIADAD